MKRLKPLNTLVYIKNNPKKIFPQIFAVALGVFLVYFISMLGGGLKYQLYNCIVAPYEKMSDVWVRNPQKDNNEFYNYFSKNNNVEKIMYCYNQKNITAKMLISSCGSYCFYLNGDNIKYIMDMNNSKLSAGRLPQSDNEVILNEDYVKGKKLKLGDYYGTDVNDKDDLNGKYKLVGTTKGDITLSFVYDGKSESEISKYEHGIILIAKKGHINALNKDIHKFVEAHTNGYDTYNYDSQYGYISSMFVMFNVFAVIILGITVFVITFTIGDINYVHFSERLSEFSMLEALGYSKSDIRYKQLSEMLTMIFVGLCAGLLFSLLGGYIFDEIYCKPSGIPLEIISRWYILLGSLVPILVSLFSSISVNRLIKKIPTVDVLEGRI